MALTATIHHCRIQLANIDRNVYADFELRVARHPSETAEYMLARILAYALEYEDGIVLTDGVGALDEPAVLVRDLTGRITAWIEVGLPDAQRLHKGSKLAGRAAVYAHRDPAQWLAQIAGEKIHRAAELPVYQFERGFMQAASAALERRSALSISLTEGQLYLDIDGKSYGSVVIRHALAQS